MANTVIPVQLTSLISPYICSIIPGVSSRLYRPLETPFLLKWYMDLVSFKPSNSSGVRGTKGQ